MTAQTFVTFVTFVFWLYILKSALKLALIVTIDDPRRVKATRGSEAIGLAACLIIADWAGYIMLAPQLK